jgi:ABC-type Mn2+/Zn2+ transport system ATPase subunit
MSTERPREVLIRLREVSIGFRAPLLHPLSFELARGELWGMVGPNGAGKTTFAKTILGLLPPLAGRVEVLVPGLRASYTPQRHRLNPGYPLSALEVVLMGRAAYLPIGRRPTPADRRRAEEELARLDLAALAGEPFRALSGGQQQRVLLARALAVDPDVLVLDEPAEGMDLLGTADTLRFLRKANAGGRMAVLMISHHLDDVISAVDHLSFISRHANLFEAGPAETMASSEKLTALYGRTIDTHQCAGKTHVHVREP